MTEQAFPAPDVSSSEETVEVREVWAIRFPDGSLSGGMYSPGSEYAEHQIRMFGEGNEIVHRTEKITRTPWTSAVPTTTADPERAALAEESDA